MHIIKMQALGNDYLLLPYEAGRDYKFLAKKLCNRRIAIGADGIIVMKMDEAEMILYKSSGTYEHMDGNALRCFARYCYSLGLGRRGHLDVMTGLGKMECMLVSENPFSCQVNLGKPIYNNSMLAVSDELDCFGRSIPIDGHYITIYSLFLGSVHTVIFVGGFDENSLNLAEDISKYPIFAKGCNVDYVHIVSKDTIEVKTYERGIGFTLASGDGCAASVVVAQKLGYTKTKVRCNLEYGFMDVEITKKGTVLLTGPAEEVFSLDYEEEK